MDATGHAGPASREPVEYARCAIRGENMKTIAELEDELRKARLKELENEPDEKVVEAKNMKEIAIPWKELAIFFAGLVVGVLVG